MDHKIDIPKTLPLLPIKETTPFPYMLLSLYIGRNSSKKSVEEALKTNRIVFLTSQKDPDTSIITEDSIYKVGVAAIVMRMRKLKNGKMKILVQGLCRGVIEKCELDDVCQTVHIKTIEEQSVTVDDKAQNLIAQVRQAIKQLSEFEQQTFSPDLVNILHQVMDPGRLTDLITGNLNLKVLDMQKILETFDPIERMMLLHTFLAKEIEISQMQNRIKNMVHKQLGQHSQQDNPQVQYPSHRMDVRDSRSEEIRELSEKIAQAQMPEDVEKEVKKNLYRLEKMHPEASEASIIRGYLDWMCALPWNKFTEDYLELENAKKVLDADHFGLNKVKERILEFLAVRRLKPDQSAKAPILCFVGPPGVGKTSLGQSIARSIGRKYARVALGGIKDEAEIRGHRRTYVGAMPGKIIQALKQVQSKNPIIVLDELDKLGSDFRGDPAAAMLEVLDPEQNNSFKDHYLNASFDLSHVLFIATANMFENIPLALRDRMETIQIPGYTPNEKLQIAEKYIVKKEMETSGVEDKFLSFTSQGLEFLISRYTKEAGLRNLTREVGSLCRKVAKKIVMGEEKSTMVTPDVIKSLLGKPKFFKEDQLKEDKVGIATGLAWTQVGGEILYVECIKLSGKGGFTLTGQLGKVMEESAKAAFSYVRSYSERLGIPPSWFRSNEVHIHLPAGAVPKDGPSAGVTLATCLISLITGTPVRRDIAMTGEIGLQGQVLPVGGVKEKALAALSHGIKYMILPKNNQHDLEDEENGEVDLTLKELKENIEFIFVETLDEVFEHALVPSPYKEKSIANLSVA